MRRSALQPRLRNTPSWTSVLVFLIIGHLEGGCTAAPLQAMLVLPEEQRRR